MLIRHSNIFSWPIYGRDCCSLRSKLLINRLCYKATCTLLSSVHLSTVRAVTFVRCQTGSSLLVSGDEFGQVQVRSAANLACVQRLEAHEACVNGVSAFSRSSQFSTCSDDQLIRIWDACSMQTPVRDLKGHGSFVVDIHTSGTDALVSCALDGSAKVWAANTSTAVSTLHPGREVHSVRFVPETHTPLLLTGHASGAVNMWDLRMLNDPCDVIVDSPRRPTPCITYFCAHQDTAAQWSSTKQRYVRPFIGHSSTSCVDSVLISADAQHVFTSSADSNIPVRQWRTAPAEPMALFRTDQSGSSRRGACRPILTSQDRYLMWGDSEGQMHLWDVFRADQECPAGNSFASIPMSRCAISACAVNDEGDMLVTGDVYGSLSIRMACEPAEGDD